MGRKEGFFRTFVDKGTPMANLLRRWIDEKAEPAERPETAYAAGLLAAIEAEIDGAAGETNLEGVSPKSRYVVSQEPETEPLTGRELEVLGLMAAGLSNRQIGGRLTITEGTVKTHVHHILAKLGAQSRTQAILRAREQQLL
jgi:LuxR family maltose regulon positive regulatory protein